MERVHEAIFAQSVVHITTTKGTFQNENRERERECAAEMTQCFI